MKSRVVQAFLLFTSGLAVAFFVNTGTASADTHILIGGNTDCTSQGLLATKQAQGDVKGTPVPVHYGDCAGDFAPWVGGTTPQAAIADGVNNAQAVWDQYCSAGQTCTIEGFSLGDAPAAIVANNVGADGLGGAPNTHLITNGNAWGEYGFLSESDNPMNVTERGLAGAFTGIPTSIPQVPGSENRNFTNDAWGNGGDQAPWAQITQAATINGDPSTGLPQHAVPDPTQPHATVTTDDGVTQEVFPGQGTYPGVIDPSPLPAGEVPDVDVPPPPA
jgi:hypothetical protein